MSHVHHARNLKKTKIVATIGPASHSYETIKRLVEEGVNVARLNFSHGDHSEHLQRLEWVRQASRELDKPVAILQDLQGPKIRCGIIPDVINIQEGKEYTLVLAQEMTDNRIPVQFDFFPYLQHNDHILINDGLVKFKLREVNQKEAICVALSSGPISSKKGINLPDTHLPNMAFTAKDAEDLKFGLAHDVDYVALSFVQSAQDIHNIKQIIQESGSSAKVVAKIETKLAVKNLKEIIDATDAVMVARGDLAVELSQEDVPIIQRDIIKLARAKHTPVIVATQMLESMVVNSEPTRAEVNDVATAVLENADAVMLSAETANGAHPVEVVKVMKRIIKRVERHYRETLTDFALATLEISQDQTTAVAAASAILAHQLKAEMICVTTSSGRTAQRVASYRPETPILVLTSNMKAYNQLALLWGVKSFFLPTIKDNQYDFLYAINKAKQKGYVQSGDKVVFVTGQQPGVAGGTNTIKVETV
jgi:pyruvate kinase